MKFFKTSEERLAEDWVYEKVAEEIERNQLRKGLWLKASAEAIGDDKRARAIYVKLRVQQYVDELGIRAKVERAAHQAFQESPEKARMDRARQRTEQMRSSYSSDSLPGGGMSAGQGLALSLIFLLCLVLLVAFAA